MYIRYLLLCTLIVGLLGCTKSDEEKATVVSSERTLIDASTDEQFKLTVVNVRDELSDEDRESFDESLKLIGVRFEDIGYVFTDDVPELANIKKQFKITVHDKSAKEIIQKGEELKKELIVFKKMELKREINQLEAKRTLAISSKDKIKNIILKEYNIFKIKGKVKIKLKIKNASDKTFYRIYFKGRVSNKIDNSISLEGSFNHPISLGVKPNDQISFVISPRFQSVWHEVNLLETNFIVEVVRVDDKKGAPIYSIDSFGEKEIKRLKELKKNK